MISTIKGPPTFMNRGHSNPKPNVSTVPDTAPVAYVRAKAVVHFLFKAS